MTTMWTADLWFDPSCPYTWRTARWLREVTQVRPVRVSWHVMSLSVLNEGRDDDPEGDPEGFLWYPVRVCAAVRRQYGEDALRRFYTALWAPHERGEQDWIDGLDSGLRAAGLPAELAEAGGSGEYDADVRASHAEGVARLGEHAGSPVLAVSGPDGSSSAVFGPVVSAVPTGADAGRLWDALVLLTAVPGFHELKGPPRPATLPPP